MIDRYIDRDSFVEILWDWTKGHDHYYLKQSTIVEKIENNGRTLYAKFKRINKAPSAELISQHLLHQIIMAVPIVHDDLCDRMFFIYDGEVPERFVYLFEHLMRARGIENYLIFRGKKESIRVVSIKTDQQDISSAYKSAKELSDILATNLPKSWKILPDPSLPESYNIVTLPYIN